MGRVTHRTLENFFRQFRLARYKKGEVILHAGDPPPGIFYLKSGFIRLYSISEEGEEFTHSIFQKGDCLPLIWAMGNMENWHNLEAMTEVETWRAPKDRFLKFIKSKPELLTILMRVTLTRFASLLVRMEHLVFGNARVKVASILYLLGKWVSKKKGQKIIIKVPLTHKDIASLVGLARETTSIEIKKLEDEGLISNQKGILVIKNLNKLKKESFINSF